MATSNTIPVVIPQPIAAQATSENINVIPNGATGTNGASFQEGFPAITRMPVIKNPLPTQVSGLPPKQQDFNGLFNVVSQHNFFAQNGGMYSFNQAVSDAIGGYPKNAVLWYFPENEDPCLVYSLINDNTNNFVDDPTLIDGIHWEALVNPSSYANLALTNSPYTTNRILEIPQDIKLELNNGSLTLKSGSKLRRLTGEEWITNNDFSLNTSYYGFNQSCLIIPGSTDNGASLTHLETPNIHLCSSGTTLPTSTTYQYCWFFKTDTKEYYWTHDNGATWERRANAEFFPIAIANIGAEKWTSIDQIFNGFGYIGGTMFALPGVKIQTPNGKNEDGTYKTVIRTVDSVRTFDAGAWGTKNLNIIFSGDSLNIIFEVQPIERFTYNKKFSSDETTYSYDENTGQWWYSPDQSSWVKSALNIVGSCRVESGKITKFQVDTVDSVLNSNLSNLSAAGQAKFDAKANTDASNFTATGKETVVGWGMPDYSAGVTITSGYTATQKGLATVSMNGSDHTTNTIYVNDVKIGFSYAGNDYQEAPVNTQLSLDVGDKIRWTGTQSVIAIFFPYKGV